VVDHRDAGLGEALVEQEQRGAHRVGHVGGGGDGRRLAGEGLQRGDDAPHLVGQPGDDAEVLLDGGEVAALHELDGVARQGAHRAQRLGQFVGDARRQLAEHRQLGGLHQLVLGGAQGLLGLLAFGHFFAGGRWCR
jgi:hypothetical protein